MVTMEVRTLRSFGQRVEFEATRSVDLLKAIDDTIYACAVLKETISALATEAHNQIGNLKRADSPADPDGSIQQKLEAARDSLAALYKMFVTRRDSAHNDKRLSDEDGVVDAYDQLLDTIADTHNVMNELCWVVGEQAAEYDKPLEGEFESADDLFKAMGV